MNIYLSQCADAASKSPMYFTLRRRPRQRRKGYLEWLQPPPAALRRRRGAHARAPQARIDARGDARHIQPHRHVALLPRAIGFRRRRVPRSWKCRAPPNGRYPHRRQHPHPHGCLKARRPFAAHPGQPFMGCLSVLLSTSRWRTRDGGSGRSWSGASGKQSRVVPTRACTRRPARWIRRGACGPRDPRTNDS
ncbi:hypothetical protein EDB87DRAFT_157381 [Lactarius vividus]|nr:hypothetical protein EDB87DRAFT_157381 [Lactarius vividus]